MRVVAGDRDELVAGTMLGRTARQSLLQAWGERFDLQLVEHLTLFRYDDVPGMIGRVGTAFGARGVNISQAAVGYQPAEGRQGTAVMIVTTDAPVPQDLVDEIVASDGFVGGRSVSLD